MGGGFHEFRVGAEAAPAALLTFVIGFITGTDTSEKLQGFVNASAAVQSSSLAYIKA